MIVNSTYKSKFSKRLAYVDVSSVGKLIQEVVCKMWSRENCANGNKHFVCVNYFIHVSFCL